MPQDKRRSIGYRSFVTCDDPKGVVECGTIRKSKISSQKREQIHKFEAETKEKIPSSSSINQKEKRKMDNVGITSEVQSPTSFQLLEVSKGAQNLNHVISSWCTGNRKDVAKDLLKGALDLQESLVILSRLQQASNCISGVEKEKQTLERERRDNEFVIGSMGSNHRARVSGDGSSRKSFDELRKVIRGNLVRHNVLTNPAYEEHCDFHGKLNSSPEMMPSISSSQSSLLHSSNFASSSESSVSSTASQKKRSNLVAKLMGLESLPSSPRKPISSEKILNQKRPMFDVDSPKVIKPQSNGKEANGKWRTVDEIFESMKFKGLLRSKLRSDLSYTQDLNYDNMWIDDKPPIVIMKPLRASCLDLDCPAINIVNYGASNPIRKCKEDEKDGYGEEIDEKVEEKKARLKKKFSSNAHPKAQKKQVVEKNEIQRMNSTTRKEEKMRNVRSHNEFKSVDHTKVSASKMNKQMNGTHVTKDLTSRMQSNGVTAPISKHRTVKMRKSPGNGKQKELRNESGVSIESRSIDANKGNKNKNKEIEVACIKEIDVVCKHESISLASDTKFVDQFAINEHAEGSQIQFPGYDNDNINFLCEITMPRNDHHGTTDRETILMNKIDENNKDYEQENQNSNFELKEAHTQCETPTETPSFRTKLKAFLLRSPSFVNHAEELFNREVNVNSVLQTSTELESDTPSTRVLLDCANELMELRYLEYTQAFTPLRKTHIINPRNPFSLDQLLVEICRGIDNLRCYSDDSVMDSLHGFLDRDLRGKSVTWKVGWRNVCSEVEVEHIVSEIDKFVLGGLIEEVLTDLLL